MDAATPIGVALGFLVGVGCAAAVLYTILLARYRRALQDAAAGGIAPRYRKQLRSMHPPASGPGLTGKVPPQNRCSFITPNGCCT